MRDIKILVGVLALAIVVGGLSGCRSKRSPAASTSVATAQPAPQTTYPSRGPSVGPTTGYTYPSTPSYPTTSYPTRPQPPTTVRVVRPSQPAMSPGYGDPDAMSVGAPPVDYQPSAPRVVRTVPAQPPVLVANPGNEIDAEIARIQARLDAMEHDASRPVVVENESPALAADSSGRAAAFADQLRGNCKGGEVLQEGSVVIVRLTDAFLSGSDKLRKNPALVTTLLSTANALTSAGAQEVLVVGHSDGDRIKKSKWPSNKALSEARAQRVAQELSRRGVPACDLEVFGEGFAQPLVASERSKADKARNRRVEIHIRF